VNFIPKRAGALTEAAQSLGLTPTATLPDAKDFAGKVLVWEAVKVPAGGIGIVREEWIRNYVQKGGSLILTLSRNPGGSPLRIADISPTTAWYTQILAASRGGAAGGVQGVEWDSEMYGEQGGQSLSLPYYFKLQPVSAVERGMERYERFDWTIPYINQHCFPGRTFWSRPLLNRDWRVRVKGDDIDGSGLVLTGRYGAGRVAVLAAGVTDLKTGTGDGNFWKPLLEWLTAPEKKPSAKPVDVKITPAVTVDRAKRTLNVAVRNPASSPLKVTVIARLETWEQAYVGDVEQELTIPANGSETASLSLPTAVATGYQALDYRDKWDARVGVLSETGASLLSETRLPVDLDPDIRLAVATDEIGAMEYPFKKAPGPSSLFFGQRMGTYISSYSYAPGADAHALITVTNGAWNLAPLAKVRDETTPDNKSIMALNDEMADAGKVPRGVQGYGTWNGQAGKENVLVFTLPQPAAVNAVTFIGNPGVDSHNAGAASIEVDNQEVVKSDDLDTRFKPEGRVTLSFPEVTGTAVRIKLPWLNDGTPEQKREEPRLAEVEIYGWTGRMPGDIKGHLKAELRDSLTGEVIPVSEQDVTVKGGAAETFTLPFKMPELDNQAARYLTLQSTFRVDGSAKGELTKDAPLMVIEPKHPLNSVKELRGDENLGLGFIVTRGFRNADKIGTGTQEVQGSWEEPDDAVWAYSRDLKQTSKKTKTLAARFYVSDTGIDRFANPWTNYLNGEDYFGVSAPRLVEAAKQSDKWGKSDTVTFGFSDRWDSGPAVGALYGWAEMVAFDEYLKANNPPGIQGGTRAEVSADITDHHESEFRSWQLDRYSSAVKDMSDAFAREGKKLVISGQGIPIVPEAYEATLSKTICGMSDDETWGMVNEDPCLSTGKQMGYLAFNPSWRLATLLQWGYNSATLCNPNWWAPVGTTEPSRRHYYDRAWRASFDADGHYHSIHAFGYNTNAYTAYTMSPNDWQEWWRLEERHSLISPDGPFGAGVVLGTSWMSDPNKTDFSGGGTGGSGADHYVNDLAQAIKHLHEAGIDISFSTNAAALDKLPADSPLIICNLSEFSTSEVQALKKLADRGVRMVAFQGGNPLSPEAARLFGTTPESFPIEPPPLPGQRRKAPPPPKVVRTGKTCFIGGAIANFNEALVKTLGADFQDVLQLPLQFPEGSAGYGFTMGNQHYIVVEDWLEKARILSVRYRPKQGVKDIHAVNVNDNRTLTVRRVREGGDDWLIDLPTRPGDGSLICVEEEQ